MLQNIDLSDVDIICTTGQVAEEPYTTENLSQLTGGYKMLTNVTELLRVNFCNPHVSTLRSLNNAIFWICRKDGWICLLNIISVISSLWRAVYERLCAVETFFTERILSPAGFEPSLLA